MILMNESLKVIIPIVVISLIVFGAIFYIVKSKKNGQKCIGCPFSKTCNKNKCSNN